MQLGQAFVPVHSLSCYVAAGLLTITDQLVPLGDFGRLGLGVLIVGGIIHLADKQDRNNKAVHDKIDRSVGKVWDAGGRAREREMRLEASQQGPDLATVHRLGRHQ